MALCLTVARAGAADPAPVPIATGAGLDWGIKSSFRKYIEGPIAGGEIAVAEGATRNPDGTFHFPVGAGEYDATSKALVLRFDGSVHMTGHHGALDMTVREPRVVITPMETSLYAKVVSAPIDGSEPGAEADVHFGSLDLTGIEPSVASGVTTWSGVKSLVAAGAIAPFAGHYTVGTELDPLTFSYEGEGGKPEPAVETWTEPGSTIYDVTASRQPSGSPWRVAPLAYDQARDVLHVAEMIETDSVDTMSIQAVDPVTLASVGDPAIVSGYLQISTQNVAYDEDDGTLILKLVGLPGKLVEVRWNDEAEEYSVSEIEAVNGVAIPQDITTLRYDEVNDRLYGLLGSFSGEQGLMVLHKGEGEWFWPIVHRDPEGFPGTESELPLDGRFLTSLDVMSDGTVVLANKATGGLGIFWEPVVREAFAYFHDNWGEAILVPIPATKATILDEQWVPNGTGPEYADTNGYVDAFAGPGNRLHLVERGFYPQRVTTIRKSGWDWTVLSEVPTALPLQGQGIVTSDNALAMHRVGTNAPVVGNGKVLGKIPVKGNMTAGPDGSVYVAHGHVVKRFDIVGVSPTIVEGPKNRRVALGGDEESAEATFEAAASGQPAPSLQWQTRAPGATAASAWQPIDGETGPTLTVAAEREDSGRQYRALFRNEASVAGVPQLVGEIATPPATLTVDYAPSVVNQPEDAAVVVGEDAVFKTMPAGAPYPQVFWQRRVGGYWQNLDSSTGDFEIVGGLLAVAVANSEMSGSQFRARIVNSVGAVNSQVVTLTVSEPPPTEVTFGSGHLDWGLKQSFRDYIGGPIAHGSSSTSSGATLNSDGTIRFEVLGGAYDTATDTGEIETDGSVRFTGHDAGQGPLLDLTIADPRIEIEGEVGTLIADVVSRGLSDGQLEQFPDVAFAKLDFSGSTPTPIEGGLGFEEIAAALSEDGVPAFADFYPAGTPLDPISLEAIFGTPREAEPDPEPETEGEPGPSGSTAALATAASTPKAGKKTLRCKSGRRKVRVKRTGRVRCVRAKAAGKKAKRHDGRAG